METPSPTGDSVDPGGSEPVAEDAARAGRNGLERKASEPTSPGIWIVAADGERVEALALADEILDTLDDEDRDLFCGLFDTTDSDSTIVERVGVELAEVTGIGEQAELLRWVRAARPTLLEQLAYDMNEWEGAMGREGLWIVCRGVVVDDGGAVHRELMRRRPRGRWRRIVRPLVPGRSRSRRTRRSSGSRASPAYVSTGTD